MKERRFERYRRFGSRLRKPADGRRISVVLRRFHRTGRLEMLRPGRPHWEALYADDEHSSRQEEPSCSEGEGSSRQAEASSAEMNVHPARMNASPRADEASSSQEKRSSAENERSSCPEEGFSAGGRTLILPGGRLVRR
jgi:hypothetical protein